MNNKEIIIQIDKYIKGELSTKETDQLWMQFLEKPAYFDWFETELHLRYLVGKNKKNSKSSPENPPRKATFSLYKNWFLAAAAIVIIGFGLQFASTGGGNLTAQLALENIHHTELMGSDIMRSGNQQTDEIDISINEALAAALEGDPETAIKKFREILSGSPDNQQRARVEMNLGILLYNQAEYETAQAHFIAITELNTLSKYFEEKAWWFLGNTYLNLNRIEEAREAIFNAYTLDGRYKSPALDLLKRLDLELGNVLADDESPASV